ncbi:MAG: hypothetical protein WC506_00730 [Candidatus Micrarchaeia archaeon]
MDIGSAWKSACKVFLKAEIGELDEYAGHLSRFVNPAGRHVSEMSGRKVLVSSNGFAPGSRFISFDESARYDAMLAKARLGINEIKDMDSVLEALGEKLYYAGNVVLGNSGHISDSASCSNSFCVRDSNDIADSKYVAYSSMIRYGEYTFGCHLLGQGQFMLRTIQCGSDSKIMEGLKVYYCSECAYVASLENCTSCMFSFNQKGRHHLIGNAEYPRDQYERLAGKLVEDIRQELEGKKAAPSILDIVKGPRAARTQKRITFRTKAVPKKTEEEFAAVTRLVLGRELHAVKDYEAWLWENVQQIKKTASSISGKEVLISPECHFEEAEGRLVTLEEEKELGKLSLPKEGIESLSLENAASMLEKISMTSSDLHAGKNIAMSDSAMYRESSGCYQASCVAYCKSCAYCFWPRQSENCFGSSLVFSSKFCMKCYNSTGLNRCFEVSDSANCTDSYFCHNCENLQNCMFCFNTKAKRYAIGNVEVGRDAFLKIKERLLGEIGAKLEKNKALEQNIYNIGASKPAKK